MLALRVFMRRTRGAKCSAIAAVAEAQRKLELKQLRSWLREQFGTGGQAHLERLPREATRALPRSPARIAARRRWDASHGTCRSAPIRELYSARRVLFLGWWPIEIPKCRAFCLKAPGVRFIVLEIALTGVLLFECFLSSLSS
jgi:hypothetical protein